MRLLAVFIFFIGLSGFAQTIPSERGVDWTLSGLRNTTTSGFMIIELQSYGVVGDGVIANDAIISNLLSTISGPGAILIFPSGNFLFNNSIVIPSNVIIKGQGADSTTLTMDLGGTGHAIKILGHSLISDTTSLIQSATKDSSYIMISDTSQFSSGDWIRIIQQDADLVTSSWAENTVGQIVYIEEINNNKAVLASPLRMDYDITRSPFIRKINPVKNVGIECIKIHRMDDAAPQQSSNIFFSNAVNCWVKGIESQNCTFSHIEAEYSSNLYVAGSYIHHAFDYGGGGRAYGVMLHFTTNECLVENNIFEHLRHSMILQAGANGNVFSYNYSFDPFWSSIPNDAAGDMVLHGNYPYTNLFEQNICHNIVIDNSHGPNGPYNTVFRNRAESYGIMLTASNSPNQNILGNDIPNTSFPYSFFNYSIQGTGHLIHGNNNKGTIDPSGTNVLPDSSYAYDERPDFLPPEQWAAIGTPNIMGAASLPARDRYLSGNMFNPCSEPCIEQQMDIDLGWNIISSYIIPDEPNMDSIIKDVKSQIILIKDGAGQVVFPSFGINQIGDWNTLKGYKVKSSSDLSFNLGCKRVDPSTPIILSNGWAIISFLRDQPLDAGTAFASLDSLVLAKDALGQAYFPTLNINTIGDLQPGQGYNIKMIGLDTLYYPLN